ncbi:NUDIX domain-containing protein [Prauserella marina]|uniref:NUDIX domain-containing protein n=1 Tax=Prauserella marina TaxID=530584 RepID=UPI000B82CE27
MGSARRHVEPGESPRQALRRELREELGIDVVHGARLRLTRAGAPVLRAPSSGRTQYLIFRPRVRADSIGTTPVVTDNGSAGLLGRSRRRRPPMLRLPSITSLPAGR